MWMARCWIAVLIRVGEVESGNLANETWFFIATEDKNKRTHYCKHALIKASNQVSVLWNGYHPS